MSKKTFFQIAFSLLVMFVLPGLTAAQSMYSNSITGTNPSTSNPYTSGQITNANLAVSGISYGPGLQPANGNDRFNADHWGVADLDLNDYYSWTITPSAGYKINFSSFAFAGQTGTNGPANIAVRSSLDNFSSNILTGNTAGSLLSVNLSGAPFQSITSPITFRLYAWGATNINGDYSINDFTFFGTLALVLPIELLEFKAAVNDDKTTLQFSTATERNNACFSIERLSEGSEFVSIGKIEGAGNSNTIRQYRFVDESPAAGLNFYRLKQVDVDGQFSYSKVISVTVVKSGFIRLFPLPAVDQMHVNLETALLNDGHWQLLDYSGRLLQSGAIPAETNDFTVDVTTLTPGAYFLRMADGQTVVTKQFQK